MYIFQFCCASLRCKLRIALGNKWSNRRLFQKFITIRQRSCGKVMFWQVSVCHSVQGRSPCVHYFWCIGLHCAGFPCSGPLLDMEPSWLQPRPRHRTWDPSASEIWWPSLETCSNLFTWGTPPLSGTDICWPQKHILSMHHNLAAVIIVTVQSYCRDLVQRSSRVFSFLAFSYIWK